MSSKYSPATPSRIYTNDLYLAALLHSQGHTPTVTRNDRRRITFAFTVCPEVLTMREAYQRGKVMVDIRSFQQSLKTIRRLMDGENEQRSLSHDHTATRLQSVA